MHFILKVPHTKREVHLISWYIDAEEKMHSLVVVGEDRRHVDESAVMHGRRQGSRVLLAAETNWLEGLPGRSMDDEIRRLALLVFASVQQHAGKISWPATSLLGWTVGTKRLLAVHTSRDGRGGKLRRPVSGGSCCDAVGVVCV